MCPRLICFGIGDERSKKQNTNPLMDSGEDLGMFMQNPVRFKPQHKLRHTKCSTRAQTRAISPMCHLGIEQHLIFMVGLFCCQFQSVNNLKKIKKFIELVQKKIWHHQILTPSQMCVVEGALARKEIEDLGSSLLQFLFILSGFDCV